MIDEVKKQFTSARILVMLLIIAVGIYLLQIGIQFLGNFSDVIIILVLAWLLSFILEPLVETQRIYLRIPKLVAASIVYLLFFGVIAAIVFLFIPPVASQMNSLSKILPQYFNSSPPLLKQELDAITSYSTSFSVVTSLAQFFFDLFLVLIISFYFIIDKETITTEIYRLIPKKWHTHAKFLQHLIDTSFGAFLRVQLIFGIIAGVTTWIILRIFNVDFAASTALISGVLTIIPLIGPVLALIPPLLIPAFTNITQAIFIFLILVAIQQIIFNIIGPKLMGKALKLHPVIVILSFLIGFKIAGWLGAIIAVPILGILTVIVHQFTRHLFEENSK